ncbi:hypothetical protein AAVH_13469 [Aphelenchoides avenae]|nr:hypothetical protein AAVH_13469 [Aphelenchus avenae]
MSGSSDKAALARVLLKLCDDSPVGPSNTYGRGRGGARGGYSGAGRGGHNGGPGKKAHELLSKEHVNAIKMVVRDAIRTELSFHVGNGGVKLENKKPAEKRKQDDAQEMPEQKRSKPTPNNDKLDDTDDNGPNLDDNGDPIYSDEDTIA